MNKEQYGYYIPQKDSEIAINKQLVFFDRTASKMNFYLYLPDGNFYNLETKEKIVNKNILQPVFIKLPFHDKTVYMLTHEANHLDAKFFAPETMRDINAYLNPEARFIKIVHMKEFLKRNENYIESQNRKEFTEDMLNRI